MILIGSIVLTPDALEWDICLFLEVLLFLKKQKKKLIVSQSSVEAEYRVIASTVNKILLVRWLLNDFQVFIDLPMTLFSDNQDACHIVNNPVFHECTQHVEMHYYFIHERVASKDLLPMQIEKNLQISNLLTKGVGAHQLQILLGKMGITNLHAPS